MVETKTKEREKLDILPPLKDGQIVSSHKVDIKPLQVKGGPIVFDWDRLKQAYFDKDISKKTYIKLALEIEYGRNASFLDIDLQAFADKISGDGQNSKGDDKTVSVNRYEVLSAIAAMGRNDQVETDIQLTLHLKF